MADSLKNYTTVGDLKKFFENLDDNIPVISSPLNRDINTAFGIRVDENGRLGGEYIGKIVILDVDLYNPQQGRRVLLVPENEPEPLRIKYNFNDNFGFENVIMEGDENNEEVEETTEDIAEEEVSDEQGNN